MTHYDRVEGLVRDAAAPGHHAAADRCAVCGVRSTVVDTRSVHRLIRRRRECPTCAARYTTYELRVSDYGFNTGEAWAAIGSCGTDAQEMADAVGEAARRVRA